MSHATVRVLALSSVFLLACSLAAVTEAADIHVPADHPTIQAALDAAVDADRVIVADGVWTGPGNRNLVFNGKEVQLLAEYGPQKCTIDCQGSESSPHRAFIFETGEGPLSVVQGFTLTGGFADRGGAIICDGASPTILDCVITGNVAEARGGGISCHYASAALISGCVITGNQVLDQTSNNGGGGVSLIHQCTVRLENCRIEGNSGYYGGGIKNRSGCDMEIVDCVIAGNQAERGGALAGLAYSDTVMTNCLITGNIGTYAGGAIFLYSDYGSPRLRETPSQTSLRFCSMVANQTGRSGGGIDIWGLDYVSIDSSIVWECGPDPLEDYFTTVLWSDVEGGYGGTGNIDQDPLFVSGPLGDHYLSQMPAGQAADSPCVDGGDPSSGLPEGTTRTDSVEDAGVADMGYHYEPASSLNMLVTGPGPGASNPPVVRVFPAEQDAVHLYEFAAYGASQYGVTVTCGELTGDLRDEILTGAGPGAIYGPHVRGFAVDGTPLPGLNFIAYGTNKYGVNVAAGDIDGDGYDEIITGAGPGAVFGPHVRGWDYDGGSEVTALSSVNYFAYGTPKWGVNVAAGDIDGDGYDEIVTGAGPGAIYGPHVRGWNVDGGAAAAISGVSFFAYGTNKFGVNVGCGDVDGDGMAEIITGAGPGQVFGAHVRGWNVDGAAVTDISGINFFAWPQEEVRYGAKVCALADLDGDGRAELLVGQGPDPAASTPVKVYRYDGAQLTQWFDLEAYDGLTHGVNVAAGRF